MALSLPEADLALLVGAARAAGEIALSHFSGERPSREKPNGGGPVTEADLQIDEMLRDKLGRARPDYGWLSEESEDDGSRLEAKRSFVIDPIDGTSAFVEGGKAWSHSMAVVEEGRVIAALVHLPVLGKTYTAIEGYGAQCNGATIWASTRTELAGARVLIKANQMKPEFWPGGAPDIDRHFRSSIAYRICLAAEGRFDAMLTFKDAWEWDVAAGVLIAREAGAVVSSRLGEPLVFNNPTATVPGVVVAGRSVHTALMERILD